MPRKEGISGFLSEVQSKIQKYGEFPSNPNKKDEVLNDLKAIIEDLKTIEGVHRSYRSK